MNVDYLPDGPEDLPVIRIFGTRQEEFRTLRDAVVALAEAGKGFAIGSLKGFEYAQEAIACSAGHKDSSISRSKSDTWTWQLTRDNWLTVAGLIEPFATTRRLNTHQWLTGRMAWHGVEFGEVSVLLLRAMAGGERACGKE